MGNGQQEGGTIAPEETALSVEERATGEIGTAAPPDKKGEEISASVGEKLKTVAAATPSRGPLILLSKSPHTPEHRNYLEKVVGENLPNVRTAFDNAGIEIPPDNKIFDAMVMSELFTGEEIDSLMRITRDPRLIVLPPCFRSYADCLKLLNRNRRRDYEAFVPISLWGGRFDESIYTAEEQAVRRLQGDKYIYGIGEAEAEFRMEWLTPKDIVENFRERNPLLRPSTLREYTVLQVQGFYPIDTFGATLLAKEGAEGEVFWISSTDSSARSCIVAASRAVPGDHVPRFELAAVKESARCFDPNRDCRIRPVLAKLATN
ncbi:MAG: hypothetical protein WC651_01055 [Candidatus Gracilibacteria bacterium]|jgi:hypothetical protein